MRNLALQCCWVSWLTAGLVVSGCSDSCRDTLQRSARMNDAAAAQGSTGTMAPAVRTQTKPPTVPLGLNLGAINYYGPTLPFVDVMKNADAPQTTPAQGGQWSSELIDKVPLDAAGWPLEVPYSGPGVSQPQWVRYSVVGLTYPGRYTLMYDGDGEFEFPAAPVQVVDRAPGVWHLDVQKSDSPLFLTITRSAKQNHVRNVRLILPGFEADYARQVFHPRFLEDVRGATVLRFMDWQHTNDSELARWSDRATPEMTQGTARGAAFETMLDLSNRLGADPWLCIPHKADDDFVEQLAKLVRDRLGPERVVYIEYSNELWNGIFGQAHYVEEQGCKAGFNKLEPYRGSCDDPGVKMWAGTKWAAKRTARIFEIFERVFGGTSRLVRVVAGQSAWMERNEIQLKAFNSPILNPRRVRADALAIAPYFGAVADQLTEKYGGSGFSVDTILQKMDDSIDSDVRDATRQNKALAERFGLRLIAYEGGQHLVAGGEHQNDEALTAKLIAANRNQRMAKLYEKMFAAWYAESGRDLLVLFNSADMPSKYGSWGLLETQDQQSEQAPKYRAFREQLVRLVLTRGSKDSAPAPSPAEPRKPTPNR